MGVKNLNKDKLVNALNAIQNGRDAGEYHDEIETIITLVMNATDEAIVVAWKDLKNDTE